MKTRVFFVSDVHGSDLCFRKFINGGRFYGADAIILGGDVTGNAVVLMLKHADGSVKVGEGGASRVLKSSAEIEAAKKAISDAGSYPYIAEAKELEELKSRSGLLGELFKQLAVDSLRAWVALADEKLAGTETMCYMSPGNDDLFEIDEVLSSGEKVINPRVESCKSREDMR